jgi:protein TonB
VKLQGSSLAWFLTLSVAAHAGLLLVPAADLPEVGDSGQVLRLSMTEQAGSRPARDVTAGRTAPPPAETVSEAQPAPVEKAPAPARPAKTAAAQPRHPRPPTMPADPATAQAATSAEAETAATAAVAGSPHPSPQESEVHLRRSVLDLVGERLDYPAIARHRGWQGTVTLRLQIEPDGRISRLDVDRTSGYPVLDRAALKSLQLASVPQAGRWLHGRALELLVPVEYRLVEG